MSSVIEIESAIADLPNDDFHVLREWFSQHAASRSSLSPQEKFERFSKLYGVLDKEEGEDLARCCEEAGNDVPIDEDYEW